MTKKTYGTLELDKDKATRTIAQAEAAVEEFMQIRERILGRLAPEALRHVADIFKRREAESRKARARKVKP